VSLIFAIVGEHHRSLLAVLLLVLLVLVLQLLLVEHRNLLA